MVASFRRNLVLKFLFVALISLFPNMNGFALLSNKPETPSVIQKNQKIIVLVHGLMRTYRSMSPLKVYFEKQGYTVYYYKYPSARYTIHEHALLLNKFIETLLTENPRSRMYFITHSLGGIILREALDSLPKDQLKKMGSVVMLAPPNQGSALAKLSVKMVPILTYFIKPLAELSSDKTAYVHHVPIPPIKMGIIAGRFDAKVPPASAQLEGLPEPAVVNTTHTFIMNHRKTKELIKNFFKKGTFEEDKKETIRTFDTSGPDVSPHKFLW